MTWLRKFHRYKLKKYTLTVVGVFGFYIVFNQVLLDRSSLDQDFSVFLREVVEDIEMNGHTKTQPLNNFRQKYLVLLDPSKTVKGSLEMIFVVKSFVGNFEIRSAIRNTWGKSKDIKMKTIFVIGYLPGLQPQLEFESNLYHDILQYNVSDIYDNLVYKTIFSVEWLVSSRVDADIVHLLDDDRMVNTDNLYKFGKSNIFQTELKMIGYCLTSTKPYRDPTSKFFLTYEEYPFYYYPPYLIGGTILTNMRVIKKLAFSFPYTRIIHIEDVYIGIVSNLLNIDIVHYKGFLAHFAPGIKLVDKLSSPNYKSYHILMEGWTQMQNRIKSSQLGIQ